MVETAILGVPSQLRCQRNGMWVQPASVHWGRTTCQGLGGPSLVDHPSLQHWLREDLCVICGNSVAPAYVCILAWMFGCENLNSIHCQFRWPCLDEHPLTISPASTLHLLYTPTATQYTSPDDIWE